MVSDRERDTIIAALRLWQVFMEKPEKFPIGRQGEDLIEIAENERTGDDASLLPDEIDELIEERINA